MYPPHALIHSLNDQPVKPRTFTSCCDCALSSWQVTLEAHQKEYESRISMYYSRRCGELIRAATIPTYGAEEGVSHDSVTCCSSPTVLLMNPVSMANVAIHPPGIIRLRHSRRHGEGPESQHYRGTEPHFAVGGNCVTVVVQRKRHNTHNTAPP
jgi:hypothetical protein